MGKFFAGVLTGALIIATIVLMGRASERKLSDSESIPPQFLDDLKAAEKKLFDPDSLAKFGIPFLQSGGGSTGVRGDVSELRFEGLTRGRFAAVVPEEDLRWALISRVKDLVRLADTVGFRGDHGGYTSFSFGKGTRALGDAPPGETWDQKDRFVVVDIQLIHRKNPTFFMSWNLILDTETRELSSERWMNGLHPVRY